MKYSQLFLILATTACLTSASFTSAKAQVHAPNFFAFSWEIAVPTNSNYLTKTSLAGARFEYRKMINPNFSLGLASSWNSYDQYYPTQTYKSADGSRAVTTDMVRQIYTVPITVIAHYYPAIANKMVKPYVGIGLGTEYAEQDAYFNIYNLSSYNWGFVARPEVGMFINFDKGVKGMISAHYQVATNKNDDFRITHLNEFGFNIGIGWSY